MVFENKHEMARYVEQNCLSDVGNPYLGEMMGKLGAIANDEVGKWFAETGYDRNEYRVDDSKFMSSLKFNVENYLTDIVKNHRTSISLAFARANYTEPTFDTYERDFWRKDYSDEELKKQAGDFVRSYLDGSKNEMEDHMRDMCVHELRVNPPMLFSKDYDLKQAQLKAFQKEAEKEALDHPASDGCTNYNYAKIKIDILEKTKPGATSDYKMSFSVRVKKPPTFGGYMTGLLVDITGSRDGGFFVYARDFHGHDCMTNFTREQMLSMDRDTFEHEAFRFELQNELVRTKSPSMGGEGKKELEGPLVVGPMVTAIDIGEDVLDIMSNVGERYPIHPGEDLPKDPAHSPSSPSIEYDMEM